MFVRPSIFRVLAAWVMLSAWLSPIQAVDKTWTTAASGTFSDPARWTPSGAPGTADNALFSAAGTYKVTITTAPPTPTNIDLNVTGGAVTFDTSLSAATYALSDDAVISGGSLTLDEVDLTVVDDLVVDDEGSLTILGSSVTSVDLYVGELTGGGTTGTLLVSGTGASFSSSGEARIGLSGATCMVTFQSSSQGTFGGTLDLAESVTNGSTGHFTVRSGATVSAAALTIAASGFSEQVGVLTVDGVGSQFSCGATVVGATANSTGMLNVTNGGTFTGSGSLILQDTGTLNLTNGILRATQLTDSGGTLNWGVGTLELTTGSITIGAGTLLGQTVRVDESRQLLIGGTTTIQSGGLLDVQGGIYDTGSLSNNGTTVFNSAGVLDLSGSITNASEGRLFVEGSTMVSAAGVSTNAGRLQLGGGAAKLTGAGTLANSGIITGDGEIANPLTNSTTGELRGEAGESLLISGVNGSNAGRISLLGGAVEFTQPLTNSSTGLITGRGTLRFAGGLTNQGNLAFSAGLTDVIGDVTNSAAGKIVTSGGGTTTFYDDVTHNGSEIRTSSGCNSVFFGSVSGSRPFTGSGTVYFEGDLAPGNSPAQVTFAGDVAFGSSARLLIELGGTTPGSQFDQLAVAGDVSLDGSLDVTNLFGFVPLPGTSFPIVTFGTRRGVFGDAVNSTNFTGLIFNPRYDDLAKVVFLDASALPGDANLDGRVTGADFTIWADHFSMPGAIWTSGDFNFDGQVTGADFTIWADHFGDTLDATAVPEAAGWQVASVGLLLCIGSRWRPIGDYMQQRARHRAGVRLRRGADPRGRQRRIFSKQLLKCPHVAAMDAIDRG